MDPDLSNNQLYLLGAAKLTIDFDAPGLDISCSDPGWTYKAYWIDGSDVKSLPDFIDFSSSSR
jgi:hypothetical protein